MKLKTCDTCRFWLKLNKGPAWSCSAIVKPHAASVRWMAIEYFQGLRGEGPTEDCLVWRERGE